MLSRNPVRQTTDSSVAAAEQLLLSLRPHGDISQLLCKLTTKVSILKKITHPPAVFTGGTDLSLIRTNLVHQTINSRRDNRGLLRVSPLAPLHGLGGVLQHESIRFILVNLTTQSSQSLTVRLGSLLKFGL